MGVDMSKCELRRLRARQFVAGWLQNGSLGGSMYKSALVGAEAYQTELGENLKEYWSWWRHVRNGWTAGRMFASKIVCLINYT